MQCKKHLLFSSDKAEKKKEAATKRLISKVRYG